MTFIDITGGDPSPGLIAGYSILAALSLACTAWAIHLGRTRLHYHSFFSVRVLFPVALSILTLENIALAVSGLYYDELANDGIENNFQSSLFMKAVFILQPFEVPILLIVVFELTYLAHKRRSVNFCGMYFDEGRRVYNTAVMSCMLRNSIRSLATLLLIMGLLVNLDVIQDDVKIEALAGRAGWWSFFTMDGDAYAKMHLLLSLIPVAVLVLVSFYLSVMLWRYGTQSSMVVHSSICNPWFYPFFGTVGMATGQVFGPKLYPVMSNAGILLFVITLLALMAEIDKDIVATNDVARFLVQVAKKGDEISVTATSRAAQSVRQSYVDSVQPINNIPTFRPFNRHSFMEEEKTMEGEKTMEFTASTSTNKSVRRFSTDATEPTSNVRRSAGSADATTHASNVHTNGEAVVVADEEMRASANTNTEVESNQPFSSDPDSVENDNTTGNADERAENSGVSDITNETKVDDAEQTKLSCSLSVVPDSLSAVEKDQETRESLSSSIVSGTFEATSDVPNVAVSTPQNAADISNVPDEKTGDALSDDSNAVVSSQAEPTKPNSPVE